MQPHVDGLLNDALLLLTNLSYSLLRQFAALVLSYLFAIPYGIAAARSRRAESVLLPTLDILQSVPILGFFPVAVLFFISVFGGSRLGVELAAVFLIFTSQAWNLAFSTYESVSAIPNELFDASRAFRLGRLGLIMKLYLPSCVPKLVYNGMMSWAGGWYFLVAAEIITVGSEEYKVPGIGSYIAEATYSGNLSHALLGLGALIFSVVIVDLLLWAPLRDYAERFRYEAFAAQEIGQPKLYQRSLKWLEKRLKRPTLPVVRLRGLEKTKEIISFVYTPLPKVRTHQKFISTLLIILVAASLTIILLYQHERIIEGVNEFMGSLKEPQFLRELSLLPQALFTSLARLGLAYVASLAWTLPLAAWLAWRARAAAFGLLDVLASIPATALFPLIINLTIHLPYGLFLTSIILTMTGVQWYILFNLIGGFRSIPSDIVEAARSFGLRGLSLWRMVMLPGVMPALITGSITGWGGGWNALIVSEYINYGGETYAVLGLGSLLDRAAYELGNLTLLLIILVTMTSTIVLMNRVIWRRVYHYVLDRYRFE
jgi:NitT/TauT family transport system permease protein